MRIVEGLIFRVIHSLQCYLLADFRQEFCGRGIKKLPSRIRFASGMRDVRVSMRLVRAGLLVLFAALFLNGGQCLATEQPEAGGAQSVSPVALIFDHISDAHEWHIFSIGETHVSIPLPVILYSRTRGEWFCFMSSRFHHGHADYQGFRLAKDGEASAAKIVEVHDGGPTGEVVKQPAPVDLSITKNVVGLVFVSILIVWVFLSVAKRYREHPNEPPKGLQSLLEPVILFVRDDIVVPSMGEKRAQRFLPYLLTVFFFILFNNLLGLIPIFPAGANLTGNITVTMVLALGTFLVTIFSGNRHYWKDIFDTPGMPVLLKRPIPIMPVVEVAGMFTKPIVLMIRLFSNMLAGHMIVLVFLCLIFLFGAMSKLAGYGITVVSVFFAFFMTVLDILVSFIQAYVFTMLSSLYFGMATQEEHH